MTLAKLIRRDERGAAAIEFAIAVPVLVSLIWGIFQIGLLMEANAGMQHALGEGARYATLYPTPTDSQIQSRIEDRLFGTQNGTLTVDQPVAGVGYKDLRVTYSMPMNFLFMEGPTVTLNRTKRVYVAI